MEPDPQEEGADPQQQQGGVPAQQDAAGAPAALAAGPQQQQRAASDAARIYLEAAHAAHGDIKRAVQAPGNHGPMLTCTTLSAEERCSLAWQSPRARQCR